MRAVWGTGLRRSGANFGLISKGSGIGRNESASALTRMADVASLRKAVLTRQGETLAVPAGRRLDPQDPQQVGRGNAVGAADAKHAARELTTASQLVCRG